MHRGKRKILSYRQLAGVISYLCQYSFFSSHWQKVIEKSEKLQKTTFQKIRFFSKTEQLFAKLLSHSSNTIGHHSKRI